MNVQKHELPPAFAREVLEHAEEYGISNIDVENRVSILDDMLSFREDKLAYALKKLDEGRIGKAVLIIKEGRGTLVIKVENVIEIRAELEDYSKILERATG